MGFRVLPAARQVSTIERPTNTLVD